MLSKKILKGFVVSVMLAGMGLASLDALSIDKGSVKVGFSAYKTEKKTQVDGTFKDVKVTFAKGSGSIADILNGAMGAINLKSLDTRMAPRNNNIINKFFNHLKKEELMGTFKDVEGDDKKGQAVLALDFNGVTKDIPMTYENEGGKLTVKGMINLNDFAKEEFEKFYTDKTIQGLHGKKTWETVDIMFSASVK